MVVFINSFCSLFFILTVLFMQFIAEGTSSECTVNLNGRFPHPEDCGKFITCYDGRKFIQPCAPGTLFNPSTLECDFPYKVKCGNQQVKSVSPLASQPFQSMFELMHLWNNPSRNFHQIMSVNNFLNNERQFNSINSGFNSFHKPLGMRNPQTQNQIYPDNNHHHDHEYHNNNDVEYDANDKIYKRTTNGGQILGNKGYYHHKHGIYFQNFNDRENQQGSKHNGYDRTSNVGFDTIRRILPPFYVPKVIYSTEDNCFPWSNVFFQQSNLCPKSIKCKKYVENCYPGSFAYKLGHCNVPVEEMCASDDFPKPVTTQAPARGVQPPTTSTPSAPKYQPPSISNRTSHGTGSRIVFPDELPAENMLPPSYVDNYLKIPSAKIWHQSKEAWSNSTVEDCAELCLQHKVIDCKSFQFMHKHQLCILIESNMGTSGLLFNQTEVDFYELKKKTVDCKTKFVCSNRKCITNDQVCNSFNDCGDLSDEINCKSQKDVPYQIKLRGSAVDHVGRVEVTVSGSNGIICGSVLDETAGDVICKELGFKLGVADMKTMELDEVPQNVSFILDNLHCNGNETSIRQCQFNKKNVQYCKPSEIRGVVCSVPGMVCKEGYWQCEKSKECIPMKMLCDTVVDCDDKTDEDLVRCQMPSQIRLAGNVQRSGELNEGRLEILKYGVWGTVCDHDFSDIEAMVVCKSLGFFGAAKVNKNSSVGAGKGPIWLHEVFCNGTEDDIGACNHGDWGDHDCEHEEDVRIICLKENTTLSNSAPNIKPKPISPPKYKTIKYDPEQCGLIDKSIYGKTKNRRTRMIHADEAVHGEHPWQASVRVREGSTSGHWCGAVVLTPWHVLTAGHCLKNLRNPYVQLGDHDMNADEGTEQMLEISDYEIHKNYNKFDLSNDLAVLRVNPPGIQFNKYIKHVCLPTAGVKLESGINCTISGWGINETSPDVQSYSNVLKSAQVPILTSDECNTSYGNDITEGMFCAGYVQGGRSDACKGDSGGPLVCNINGRHVLYGIISWGLSCGKPNHPGVYMNISHYRGWIDDVIRRSTPNII